MTPEEWAQEVVKSEAWDDAIPSSEINYELLHFMIAEAIRDAIAAERERLIGALETMPSYASPQVAAASLRAWIKYNDQP